jgi:hypothetical protein
MCPWNSQTRNTEHGISNMQKAYKLGLEVIRELSPAPDSLGMSTPGIPDNYFSPHEEVVDDNLDLNTKGSINAFDDPAEEISVLEAKKSDLAPAQKISYGTIRKSSMAGPKANPVTQNKKPSVLLARSMNKLRNSQIIESTFKHLGSVSDQSGSYQGNPCKDIGAGNNLS